MHTKSIRSELKYAIDMFLVLNPPVAAILKAWLTASKSVIPAAQSERKMTNANAKYTPVITRITFVEL